jgi:hypothetical protein
MLSNIDHHPLREVILRCLCGYACVYKNTVHLDSIQTHPLMPTEREREICKEVVDCSSGQVPRHTCEIQGRRVEDDTSLVVIVRCTRVDDLCDHDLVDAFVLEAVEYLVDARLRSSVTRVLFLDLNALSLPRLALELGVESPFGVLWDPHSLFPGGNERWPNVLFCDAISNGSKVVVQQQRSSLHPTHAVD